MLEMIVQILCAVEVQKPSVALGNAHLCALQLPQRRFLHKTAILHPRLAPRLASGIFHFFLVIPREHSDRGNLAGAYNRVWVSHHYVIARSNNGCDVAI